MLLGTNRGFGFSAFHPGSVQYFQTVEAPIR
jgi:hypothetical protein